MVWSLQLHRASQERMGSETSRLQSGGGGLPARTNGPDVWRTGHRRRSRDDGHVGGLEVRRPCSRNVRPSSRKARAGSVLGSKGLKARL